MKNVMLILFALLMISCNDKVEVRSDCLPPNLEDGVIAFYPFSDGSLLDESTGNHDLTNTSATPTSDRFGNDKCAYEFSSAGFTQEYLSTSNTNFLNGLDEFSISIWYQPIDTSRNVGDFEALVSRGNERRCPNKMGEWSVGLFDCRRAVFGHDNSAWAGFAYNFGCYGEVIALTGQWHHVVATKEGEIYRIYFNGNLEEVVVGNANCNNFIAAQDVGDLFIGNDYTGKIDDVLIYNRAISQIEVDELYGLDPCCE